MKVHWAILFFAVGLGAGWLIFGDGVRESAEGNTAAAPDVRRREARPVATPHEAKFRTFAKEIPKLSAADREAFKKSLAPADRPASIDAMLAQAGPNGISTEAHNIIDDILRTWAGEDFDGAWAWCRQIESDDSRIHVTRNLLGNLAEKDPDRAFALHLEMIAGEPGFKSSLVPLKILRNATSKDASSFLNVLGKLPLGSESYAYPVEFAGNFDFQQAADGLTTFAKSHQPAPPVLPSNFLSTWAARDADAAYAWFSKEPGAVKFEGLANLLDGIEKQGVSGASYAWAAEKLNESGTARDAMIRSLTRSPSDDLRNTVASIAQAMPDAASSDRFLGDVVAMALQDPAVTFGYALTQMSTPEARLETLQRLSKAKNLNVANIPDAQLQHWGLTRQQVEQAQASGR